jgi:hypothetical protein
VTRIAFAGRDIDDAKFGGWTDGEPRVERSTPAGVCVWPLVIRLTSSDCELLAVETAKTYTTSLMYSGSSAVCFPIVRNHLMLKIRLAGPA